MKILWFEVTTPGCYKSDSSVIGGWQDSLEHIIRNSPDIELYVAFQSKVHAQIKTISKVTYVPITLKYNWFERQKSKWTWKIYAEKVKDAAADIVERIQPDIIHCFGSEWLWGLVAERTTIPCVIHIQGSIISYMNAQYPPGYNAYTMAECFPKKILSIKKQKIWKNSWLEQESRVWKVVKYYMGRTEWDKALLKVLNPEAIYFHVDEALRPSFLEEGEKWTWKNDSTITLISTGCSTFWKGPDMMLKTAHILTKMKIVFKWIVVGKMNEMIKQIVEKHEGMKFSENNINLIGYTQPDDLKNMLCRSTMYVHTAYVENSPNSICEAQILGVPIVSTNVGGISTLVRNNAILVPANDPWQMAAAIIDLAANKEKSILISEQGKKIAKTRHNSECIKKQLFDCYNYIIDEKTNT